MSNITQRRRVVYKALWPGECYHIWKPYGYINTERCLLCKKKRFITSGPPDKNPNLTDSDGMGRILKRLRDFDKFFGIVFSPISMDQKKTKASICWDELDEMATPYKAIAATESLALFKAVEKLIKKEF